MHPKPERVGLYVPDGFTDGDYRQALYVGTDRVAVRVEDIEASQAFLGSAESRVDIRIRFTDSLYSAVRALRAEHTGQPLVLLANGVLVGEVQILDAASEDRVLAVPSLEEGRVNAIRDALGVEQRSGRPTEASRLPAFTRA